MFKSIFKNKNVKDSILYTSGNYFFRISLLISNLISSRILGPSLTGIITYINAIDQNINIAYSTLRSSIEREVPKLNTNDNTEEYEKFVSTSFMVSYIMFILGSIIYYGIYITSDNEYIRKTCIFFILINIIKALSDLLRIYHKSIGNFKAITIMLIIVSILQPILVVTIVNKFFYDGFLWTRIILYGLSVILLVIPLKKYPKLIFHIEWFYLKRMLLHGLPIVAFGLITTLLITLDKIYIKNALGDSMLGYYSIGALIFQVVLVLPESMYGSYFPKYITYIGDQEEKIDKLSNLIRLIIIPVIFTSWIFTPLFVNIFLPKFALGIISAKILILSVYFAASYQMYYYELIRLNKYKKLLIGLTLLMIFFFILYTIAGKLFTSIEQYAFTNVIVFILFAFLVIFITLREMGKKNKDILIKLALELLKIYPLIPVLIIDFYFSYSLKTELIKIFIFSLLYLPILVKNKNYLLNIFSKKND